jgi:hypothetical protein
MVIGLFLTILGLYPLYDPVPVMRLIIRARTPFSADPAAQALFKSAAGREAVVGILILAFWIMGDYRSMRLVLMTWAIVVSLTDTMAGRSLGSTGILLADGSMASLVVAVTQITMFAPEAYRSIRSWLR